MKKLYYVAVAMLGLTACLNLSSCSDKDKDEPQSNIDLTGIWVCTDSNETEEYSNGLKGYGLVFFGNYFTSDINGGETAQKCIITYVGDEDINVLKNYTVSNWEGFGDGYILKGNNLTLFEGDWDRWIGTISINGDVMTFKFIYQDWIYDDTMKDQEPYDYVAKFQKIK